jgi:uncharacterized lipoprotein YmbA
MKTKSHGSSLFSLTIAGACLLLGACNLPQPVADTTRFYVLSSRPERTEATSTQHYKIALMPVDVPLFLRSKPMAVRVGANELKYVDDARWAEPLDAGIGRVFREQLEALPEIAQVSTGTDLVGPVADYQVEIRVLRCEGDTTGGEGKARFIASIVIHSANGDRVARDTMRSEVGGWDGKDYGALANKLSEAVRELARKVPALLEKGSEPKA